jgi:Transposase DNA-binding/Transposase Tn5 dimerisation domain/Transposase DDE domain
MVAPWVLDELKKADPAAPQGPTRRRRSKAPAQGRAWRLKVPAQSGPPSVRPRPAAASRRRATASWVEDEMKDVDLHDKRLNQRLSHILSDLAEKPTASIPAACGGWAETNAAYRFFDNDKVDFDAVLQPHCESTRIRIAAQPVALLVPDTTEVDVTRPEQQVRGAGPLDGGARRGVLLHLMHAFTADGTPLGTIQAIPWARDDQKPVNATKTRGQRAATPHEEKESYRWLLSMQSARAEAARCPGTRLVSVADSESDIYDVIAAGMEEPRTADWIIRSCQDRALVDDLWEDRAGLDYLREEVLAAPVLYRQPIHVRGREPKLACEDRHRRQPRKSREAVVEVRAVRVTLRAPERQAGQLADVTVNAVLITEENPPEDDVPVEWLLLTSLPIDTVDQVRLVVQYYSIRWMVEVFFRVLKSGCRVEDRRFEAVDRLLPCLAVYLIVAWRVLYVCRLGRSYPEISCEAVFELAEWQSVYMVVRREPPPKVAPKLQEMIRLVAQLGGYVNRKRADEPGPQTVWLGLQRLHDIALCWQVFGPGAREQEAAAGTAAEVV